MTAPASTPATELQKLIANARKASEARAGDATAILNWRLYQGDLWADGEGWTGPRPRAQSSKDRTDTGNVMGEIERSYVSRNLARDIIDRHVSGIAGREPLINVLFRDGRRVTQELQKRLDEYNGAITDWMEYRSVWLAVQRALTIAKATKTGVVRLYLHSSDLDRLPDSTTGIRPGLSLSEAARRLSIHAPDWNQAGAVRDREGHLQGAYYNWKDDSDQTHQEVQMRAPVDGRIITRIYPDVGSNGEPRSDPNEWDTPDGWVYEIRTEALITDSVRRLLAAANKTLTMGSRNIDLGGFVERTILNAQMPGTWKDDPENPGKRLLVPGTLNVGAGSTNFLNGHPVMQPSTNPADKGKLVPTGALSTPQVIYKDPAPWDVFKLAFEQLREAILDEADQLHVLISGDASASGVSRQQAVNDFLSSLEPTRIELEALMRWLFETLLRFALEVTGRRAEADEIRVRVQARVSAVQPTPTEIETTLKLLEAGVISRETAHARMGVEDSEAEVARQASEGVTPALAFRIVDSAPAPWVGMRALMLAFPALGITDQDVQAQRELDLSGPTGPDLTDPLADQPLAPEGTANA